MNDNEKLNRAFENVDDKYVMAAMTPPRRARRVWSRIGIVAASLAILIGAYFPIRNAVIEKQYAEIEKQYKEKYEDCLVFDDTEKGSFVIIGGHSPSKYPPWKKALYFKGELKTRTYEPNENVELLFEIGLRDDYLGAGALRLTLETVDFDVHFEGVESDGNTVLLEDAAPDKFNAEQPLKFKIVLTPNYTEDFAVGNILLSIDFVFDDVDSFFNKIDWEDFPHFSNDQRTALLEDGVLALSQVTLGYAADMFEMRLTMEDAGLLWDRMLGDHYKAHKFTPRELSNLYHAYLYRNTICATVNRYSGENPGVGFIYLSKNIRYRSQDDDLVYDPKMRELYEKVAVFRSNEGAYYPSAEARVALREQAEYILLYMKEQGIITAEEYETEFAWMAQAGTVGDMGYGYSHAVAPYYDELQDYMYTH